MGPMSVSGSNGNPTFIFFVRSTRAFTTLSWIFSCTKTRSFATQQWPVFVKHPKAMSSTAGSIFASSMMMRGPKPPSSKVSFFSPARWAMSRPVAVSPVKPIASTRGCSTRAVPTSPPGPVTMLITPGGTPARSMHSMRCAALRGVLLAGLKMTELPASIACTTNSEGRTQGKFHGVMVATVPRGSWRDM